jgi:hypothetical protein
MLVLLVAILYGLAFAFFATQNTLPTTLRLGDYLFTGIPLYLVVLGSLLLGTLLALVINLIESIPNSFALWSKDHKIDAADRTIEDRDRRIQELQMENIRLREREEHTVASEPSDEHVPTSYDQPVAKRSIWARIKDSFRPKHDHATPRFPIFKHY